MKGPRLLALTALALLFGCEDRDMSTAPSARPAPADPSAIISDGAHGGNPDFFFLPPMVPLPLGNHDFELGQFNNALKPSLKIEICQLAATPVNAQGRPTGDTPCVAGNPVKTFAPGTVKLVNLPRRENGWWSLFGLPADGFYYTLWDTRQSNLNVNKFYRIKVLIAGSPDALLGVADVDPMSSLRQWKYSATGEVIQLIDDVMLPIPFRVEHGGGPALCGASIVCKSITITNDNPIGDVQVLSAPGNNGPIAGAIFPDGWLPVGPGLPTSVVVTISSVNTGVNDIAAGTQTIPCHTGLPLQQFNGCFKFTTTPALAVDEDGNQFARAVTVVACYVLHDTEDPREKFAQLWASGPGEPAHPLVSTSDVLVLTAPTEHACGSNFVTVIGSSRHSNAFTQLASAGWLKLKGGLDRLVGVKTAYAVDLGLGGLTRRFSNVGPALSGQIQRYTTTDLTLSAGATTTATARIVGTLVHNGAVGTTGIGGLPVTFTVAPGNGTLRLIGSEAAPSTSLTSITNTNPINAESPTSGGGFAPVNWTMPSTPGTYTLTATGQALGGPITFTATVLAVTGFNVLTSVAPGNIHSCGLTSSGSAYCWGYNGTSLLGDGTTTNRVTPVGVTGGLAFTSVVTASDHTCALNNAGVAYCWGSNGDGQLGDGTTSDRNTPTAVAGGRTFVSLSGDALHSCALTGTGAAYCWGSNFNGELGDGTTTGSTVPIAVAGGITFASLTAGPFHTCGLTPNGTAYCWGWNGDGRLGNGELSNNRTTPVPVSGGLAFTSLSAGYVHTCGLTPNGTAFCWGGNASGEVGDGTSTVRSTPVAVSGGLTFGSVNVGGVHSCGVTTSGAAYCWGDNSFGQIGDGTTVNHSTPVPVSGGLTFTTLLGGGAQTCGVTSGGTAYCWGNNFWGQLGDGSTIDRATPVAVTNP